MNENSLLKLKYQELVIKLDGMEVTVNEIKKYDNILYGQLLGIDFNTPNYNEDLTIPNIDTNIIFSLIDDRMMNASLLFAIQLDNLQKSFKLFKNNNDKTYNFPAISPIKPQDFINISSPFGYRTHPIKNTILFHNGIDIKAPLNSPVYSTAQGYVISITYSDQGYGNKIVIEHEYGFETLYAHLNTINVKNGQIVTKNQLIGTVGISGLATGSHLHYEIRKNGESCDPLGYFYMDISRELFAIN